jgi:diguanylate cyclase (GGDEF)-like protein
VAADMDNLVQSGRRRAREGVSVVLVAMLLLIASMHPFPADTRQRASDGFDISTSSWPLDREPPDESRLASGDLDRGFFVDPMPARLLAPHPQRLHWRRIAPATPWLEASPPVLALYVPYFNRVRVLAPPDYRPRDLSLRDPDFDGDRSRHALLVELPADWDASRPVYLALEPARRLPLRLSLESRANFDVADIQHLRTVLPLLSLLAFITVIVAAFGLVLRERDMLLLACALCAMLFFQGLILGEFYALPGGDRLAAAGFRPVWTARALQEAFLALFALVFYAAQQRTPRLSRAIYAVAAGLFLVAVLAWIPLGSFVDWLSRIGSVLLAAAIVLIFTTAVIAWRQGSRQAGMFLLAWLPLMVLDALRELELLGVLRWYPENEYLPLVAAIWAAGMFAFGVGDRLVHVRRERDAAIDAAERDPLTGVLNRTGILERMRRAMADGSGRLAVLFVDLDHFKAINDRFGHAVGDACLKHAVQAITAELRKADSIGRIGGEEFLAVLPAIGERDAHDIAERIRARVELSCANVDSHAVALTLSIGVAATDGGIDHPQLLARADAAMYQAKLQGRNRVSTASHAV